VDEKRNDEGGGGDGAAEVKKLVVSSILRPFNFVSVSLGPQRRKTVREHYLLSLLMKLTRVKGAKT